MIKSFKFQLKYILEFFLTFIAFVSCFTIINILTATSNTENIFTATIPFITAMLLILPTAIFVSLLSTNVPLALQLGATRQGYFWGAQLHKIAINLIISLAIFILIYFIEKDLAEFWVLLAVFSITMLFSTIGESIGLMFLTLGKWGLIIYFLIIGGVFGTIGFMKGFFNTSIKEIFSNFLKAIIESRILIGVAVLVVVIIMTAINNFIIRKVTIK